MWTAKDSGTLLTGVGGFIEAIGAGKEAQSMVDITASNAATRLDDMRQLTKSMNDNAKQLTRGSRKAAGRMRLAVAASNITMEGSPLMAMEELHQQGVEDLRALHERARYQHEALGKQMEMDYMKTISDLKGETYKHLGNAFSYGAKAFGS